MSTRDPASKWQPSIKSPCGILWKGVLESLTHLGQGAYKSVNNLPHYRQFCLICVTRLSIMLNWLHERDPIRYDVYCTLIKVAGKAGMMDQITVSLDQVDT